MGILENLKASASVLLEANKIDQYNQILDVMKQLREMQDKLLELEQENKSLKEKLKIKDDLTCLDNVYWLKSNKDGPFCTRCYDKNKDLIRLKYENPYYKCPECKNSYEGPDIDSYRQRLINLSRQGPTY